MPYPLPVARPTKLVPRDEAGPLAESLKREGKTLVFTNGVFDLLHLGHVESLAFARSQGDVLIVGLNSDASARRIRPKGRPLFSEDDRARVLSALESVDHIILFDEETPESLIQEIKPDVLVKGGDYEANPEDLPGYRFVTGSGGRVVFAPYREGYSTTEILNRAAELAEGTKSSEF
jgi:rfaE bifunctional protein nucleotidyltransferase chain/domain